MSQGLLCNNVIMSNRIRHGSYCDDKLSTIGSTDPAVVLPAQIPSSIRSNPALPSRPERSLFERVCCFCKDTIWGSLKNIASLIRKFFIDGYNRIIHLIYGKPFCADYYFSNTAKNIADSIRLRRYVIDRCSNPELRISDTHLLQPLKACGTKNYFVVDDEAGVITYLDLILARIQHVETISKSLLKLGNEENFLFNKLIDDISRDVELLKDFYKHENEALNTLISKLFMHKKSEETLTADNKIKILHEAERLDMQENCNESLMPQGEGEQAVHTSHLSREALCRYNLRLIVLDIALQYYEQFITELKKSKERKPPASTRARSYVEKLYIRSINSAIHKFRVSEAYRNNSFTFIPKSGNNSKHIVNEIYNKLYGIATDKECSHNKTVRIADEVA